MRTTLFHEPRRLYLRVSGIAPGNPGFAARLQQPWVSYIRPGALGDLEDRTSNTCARDLAGKEPDTVAACAFLKPGHERVALSVEDD